MKKDITGNNLKSAEGEGRGGEERGIFMGRLIIRVPTTLSSSLVKNGQ